MLLAPLCPECLDGHPVPSNCSKDAAKHLRKITGRKVALAHRFRDLSPELLGCMLGHKVTTDGVCARDKLFTSWQTGSRL